MVKRTLIGTCLFAAAASSGALTLGSVDGGVVIGQPLKLRIPVLGQESESLTPLCQVVRVKMGDDALSPGLVQTSVLPDSQRASRVFVQLETRGPVTEPFVQIDLVVGCGNQVSRSFTLLADLPTVEAGRMLPQPALGRAGSEATPARAASSVRESEVGSRSDASSLPKTSAGVSKGPARPVSSNPSTKARPVAVQPNLPQPQKAGLPAPAMGEGARLQLDPVELRSAAEAAVPRLRLSSDVSTSFQESTALDETGSKRREAALALWKALNEAPEDAAADQLKAQALAQQNSQLKGTLAAAQQAQQEAEKRALEAEEGIYTHPITLGLLAVLLAGGGAIAVWRRKLAGASDARVDGNAWWQSPSVAHAEKRLAKRTATQKVDRPGLKESLQALWGRLNRRKVKPVEVDSLLSTLEEPDLNADVGRSNAGLAQAAARIEAASKQGSGFSPSIPAVAAPSDFANSTLLDGSRSVATEELLDLQQQVEFFISLGQSDQAVEVLLAHLADSNEPSPLAYLDLLKLYHELGKRTEYDSLRADFNRIFQGRAPDFDSYAHSRRGLERYEAALTRIQHLWPQPAVLDVIERSIFRRDQSEPSEAFDLEAYRELLLLYSVARERIAEDRRLAGSASGAASEPSSKGVETGDTQLQPLSTAQAAFKRGPASAKDPAVAALAGVAPGSAVHEELDLDLSQFPDDALDEPDSAVARLEADSLDLELPDPEVPQVENDLLAPNQNPFSLAVAPASNQVTPLEVSPPEDLLDFSLPVPVVPDTNAEATSSAAAEVSLLDLSLGDLPDQKLSIRKSGEERS